MIEENMIAWAAGIYEGEGSTSRICAVRISQKDTWILYKFKELFGGYIYLRKRESGKTDNFWYMGGEKGRDLLKLFMPYLSPRRLKQIEKKKSLGVYNRKTHCRRGHPREYGNMYIDNFGGKRCKECARLSLNRNRKIA